MGQTNGSTRSLQHIYRNSLLKATNQQRDMIGVRFIMEHSEDNNK